MTTEASKRADYTKLYFRSPKTASTQLDSSSWWYAGASGLQIFIQANGKTSSATINRRQLRELIKQLAAIGATP